MALVLALAACSGRPATDPVEADPGQPAYGGVLRFAEPRPYDNFVIENSLWATSQIINNIADRLTWQDPDTGEIHPWLAESWTISEDRTEYTFRIRQGVTHSDGSVLDAENVQRNYDKFGLGDAAKGFPQHRYFGGYSSSEVLDPYTVKFTLQEPNAGFLQVTSTYLTGIVSNATLALNRDQQGLIENVAGSGPFVFGDHAQDLSRVTLRAREDYDWAPPHFAHQGRAYLDAIEFTLISEDSVRTGAIQTGEADIARNVQPDDEELLRGYDIDFLYEPVLGDVNGLYLRQDTPHTSDLRVRQALQAATDRQEIRDTIYNENYGVARSVLQDTDAYFVDLYDEYLTYDLAKARRLLEEAGYALDADGFYAKDGTRLAFDVYAQATYPRSKQTLELLAQQWKKAGVELNTKQADPGTEAAAQAEAAIRQGQNSRADIDFLRAQYGSAFGNLGHLPAPAELDALLTAQATAATPDDRRAAAEAIQRALLEEVVRIPLYQETQVFALNKRVHGFTTEPVTRAAFYDTWLSPES
jgi:peptide/nickel transport system substrate-binding protein